MILLVAGHETTASSLGWAFSALPRHPKVLGRLTDEIDAGQDDAYLTATIQETLRRRPVLPGFRSAAGAGAAWARLRDGEMKLVLRAVLRACELRPPGSGAEVARRRNITVWPGGGARVVLGARTPAAVVTA